MTNSGNTKFCTDCGNSLIETAVICPKCGSPTRNFNQSTHTATQGVAYSGADNPQARSKTAAVLLAVFVGVWSFLYTFRSDAAAFWLGLAAPFVATLLAILISGGRLVGWQIIFAIFVSALVSVLAIVRQATRSSEWFARYPDNRSIR
jgi:hypothetical protein